MSAPDYAQYIPKILLAITEASTDVTPMNRQFFITARLAHCPNPGEGLLTEPTPAVRPWSRERVCMHALPCWYGVRELGFDEAFAFDYESSPITSPFVGAAL